MAEGEITTSSGILELEVWGHALVVYMYMYMYNHWTGMMEWNDGFANSAKKRSRGQTMCHFNACLVAMGLEEIAPTASCLANYIKLQSCQGSLSH